PAGAGAVVRGRPDRRGRRRGGTGLGLPGRVRAEPGPGRVAAAAPPEPAAGGAAAGGPGRLVAGAGVPHRRGPGDRGRPGPGRLPGRPRPLRAHRSATWGRPVAGGRLAVAGTAIIRTRP